MKGRFLLGVLFALIAIGALAIRLGQLEKRPMHADEAVQAERFRQLWEEGRYVYNPDEFHGPTLSYATLPSVWLGQPQRFADTSESTYRVVPVVFGVGLIGLLLLLVGGLRGGAILAAGLLTAVSPAMVFYSRDYIHETVFLFFTLGAIATGWRYCRSGKLAWCLAAGTCLGLMQATKETSVLVFFAMAAAGVLAFLWTRLLGESSPELLSSERPTLSPWHLAGGLAAGLFSATLLLSSFFTNPRGPIDGVLTYFAWADRAGGATSHVHPWYEYLHRLTWWQVGDGPVWTEGLIVALATAGFAAALLPKRRLLRDLDVSLVRWIGFFTLILVVVYSSIPYKTPWCMLGFLHPMILLAGVGAVALMRAVPTWFLKGMLALALVAAVGQLAWQAHRASYVMADDPKNPYVYAQTRSNIARLIEDVEVLAEAASVGYAVPIKVLWTDAYYWPLPWTLRRFGNVGYWTALPDDPSAPIVLASPEFDIVLASPEFDAVLTKQLDATHIMTGFYEIRPNVMAQLWVRMDLWEAHLVRRGMIEKSSHFP